MLTPTDPISATGLFCGSCGAQSSPTAKFCGEYGRRLTQATQSAARCQVLRSGLRARSAPRSPTVGLWVMSTNPTRLVMSVSSLMDQHFPGVACIRSTEYSATGSGPFLQALMWVSRSISQPPAGQRGEGRGEQLLDVMRVPVV